MKIVRKLVRLAAAVAVMSTVLGAGTAQAHSPPATLDLRPAEAGVLEAPGEFSPAAFQRVIVTVTAPGYESETAWFTGFGNRAY